MQYFLIIALQAYCIYHVLKFRKPFYWIFLILFLPVLGCAIYLITQVYKKPNVNKFQEEIVSIVNPAKKVKDLEKRLEFSDTYQNRVDLADAYLEAKTFDKAINHYLEALEDKAQNSFYVITKLIEAYFYVENYPEVIDYANKIKDEPEFRKSRAQFILGMAQEKMGDFEAAESNLRKIDIRYSFYEERLVLAKFLITHNKTTDAQDILEEIMLESQNMTNTNKRLYWETVQEAKKVLAKISE